MEKKIDPGRFTIRLDVQNPEAQIVAQLLNSLGRRKGQYIVNAVLCYIDAPRAGAGGLIPFTQKKPPETPKMERQHSRKPTEHVPVPARAPQEPAAPQLDTGLSSEVESVLQSALAAFNA